MKRKYIKKIFSIFHRTKAYPGDIIGIAGAIGGSPTPLDKEGDFLSHCKHVHSTAILSDGLHPAIRNIMERSGVSAEIQLENLPFGPQMMHNHGSQPSTLYQLALHDGHFHEILVAADPKQFADLAADFQKRFGESLHAIGRIVNGDPQRVNYIENGFGAIEFAPQWEHLC